MRTIWKYTLPDGYGTLNVPEGGHARHFAMQGSVPTVWVEVDDSKPPQPRTFFVIGTGHEIKSPAAYVGTCQGGPFVWHLYEVL